MFKNKNELRKAMMLFPLSDQKEMLQVWINQLDIVTCAPTGKTIAGVRNKVEWGTQIIEEQMIVD